MSSLKTVQRVTLSLPKMTISLLEQHVPKMERSKFIAQLITRELAGQKKSPKSFAAVKAFWEDFNRMHPDKCEGSAVELQRQDRASH